jgi:hypothetical protein
MRTMQRSVIAFALALVWAIPVMAVEPPTMFVHPMCVDDESEFLWTIDIGVAPGDPVDFYLSANQGDGQSISGFPVRAGNENMVVVGLEGRGDVTFTLEGTGVSQTVAGNTHRCYATPAPAVTAKPDAQEEITGPVVLPETSTDGYVFEGE